MYYFKKRTRLITLSALLLVSSTPTKSFEPVTVAIGIGSFLAGATGTYLFLPSPKKVPLPEHAVKQTESVLQKIKREHSSLFTAHTQQREGDFRKKLCPLLRNTGDVATQEHQLQASELEIDQQLGLLQQIKAQKKQLTTEQKIELSKKEKEAQEVLQQVRSAFNRFKKNKGYFNLNAGLNEAQEAQSFTTQTYPLIAKDSNLQSRRDRLANIAQAARELGYGDIRERAEYVEQSLRREQINLQSSSHYHNESRDKREHARQIDVQKQMNAELERQRDRDRAIRRQEIAVEKQRNALRQEAIDLETGRTTQRLKKQFEREYRNILAQKDTQLRKTQAREQNSNNQLAEKTRLVAALQKNNTELQKQLRSLQAREREINNQAEGVKQCDQEGCIIPHCPGHPKPSAPPYQGEGEGFTPGGPPPAATGTSRHRT